MPRRSCRIGRYFAESSYSGKCRYATSSDSRFIVVTGRTYYRAGKLAEAAKFLEQSSQGEGADSVEAAHWLCRIHLQNKEPAKAAELAKNSLAKAGDSPMKVQLQMDQADALYEVAATKAEALKLYQAIASENPQHEIAPPALYNAALTAQELKQYDEAIASTDAFLKAYANDALAPDVKHVAAESLLIQSKHAEAEKAYRDLIASAPQHTEAEQWQIRLALSLYLQKKYQETIDTLAKIAGAIK